MNFFQISQFNNEINIYLSKEQLQLNDIKNINKILEGFSTSYYDNPKYLDIINKVFTHSVKTNNISTLQLLTTHPHYSKKINDNNTFEGLLTHFDYIDILPALKRRGFPLWAFHVRNGWSDFTL